MVPKWVHLLSDPGGHKGVKMNFREKSENVTLLHSLILSYMQKIRKIYRAVFRENRGRQTERETDPNSRVLHAIAITKPSDQKINLSAR